MFNSIAVLKETRTEETRVALIPDDAQRLFDLGYAVTIQKDAGLKAGFTDRDYRVKNARICDFHLSLLKTIDILLLFKRPDRIQEQKILEYLPPGTLILGFLDPYWKTQQHLHLYQKQKITALAWELFPNIPATQQFDALAEMSWLTGEIVLEDYMENYQENLENKNILIIGLGNIGLSCAKFALARKANVVTVTRSTFYQELIESQDGKFIQMQGDRSQQKQLIENILLTHSCDLVICCARVRFQVAPLLISKEVLLQLSHKTVIYDLAASLGGNCEASQYGKNVAYGMVDIRSQTGYPKNRPKLASERYSHCMIKFLESLARETSEAIAQLCLESCLVCDGEINPVLKQDRANWMNCSADSEIQKFRDRVFAWHTNYLKKLKHLTIV